MIDINLRSEMHTVKVHFAYNLYSSCLKLLMIDEVILSHYKCILFFLKSHSDVDESDLFVQLDVFDEQRIQDEDELTGDDGVDLNNPVQVFNALFVEVDKLSNL